MASVIGPYVHRQARNGQGFKIVRKYVDLGEQQTRGPAVTGTDSGLSSYTGDAAYSEIAAADPWCGVHKSAGLPSVVNNRKVWQLSILQNADVRYCIFGRGEDLMVGSRR